MLDDERIKLANRNFIQYLNEGLSPMWVIVSSYYSMYYMSNSVLNKLGFKVGDQISHRVTADALIVHVRDKLKSHILKEFDDAKKEYVEIDNLTDDIIEFYDLEHKKRLKSQYVMGYDAKISKSNTSFNRAKKFVNELEKVLLDL
ncbi:hypothetical protein [Methanobacterium spitsbergense]|uniref:HEPN domain-containing protein n=1 Tax=Methanobacterium spitsbergense TaxID=2874285 RepID=A0A8T5UYG7_9EURY|nr:hypothetical protein [Methanobacterium spitsbergense]MBZ2164621.1 hypothetical protein [Methanobacterium spitsbergense]